MFSIITFVKDCRCFKAGSLVEFRPGVNLIVGDQGCGKSTLLSALEGFTKTKGGKDSYVHPDFKGAATAKWAGPPGRFGHFDFEKGNPRTQPGFGMDDRYDETFQIQSMFSSHGETSNAILNVLASKLGPNVFSFDEPDMALSYRSIVKVIRDLRANVEPDTQVLLAVHNTDLILEFSPVLSLEHGRWMPSDEFLASHQKDPAPVFDRKPRTVTILRSKEEDIPCPVTASSAGKAKSARPRKTSKRP